MNSRLSFQKYLVHGAFSKGRHRAHADVYNAGPRDTQHTEIKVIFWRLNYSHFKKKPFRTVSLQKDATILKHRQVSWSR